MDDLTLQATKRDVMRKNTRFLRRQGITPVHLFGHSIESQSLQCDTLVLKHIIAQARLTRPIRLKIDAEKQAKTVFIKEIQKNAVSGELFHVDFYQVKKGDTMRVDVPIVTVGEAPALKVKGRMLTHGITSLHVECLPENLPSEIEIDLSILEELEQAIYVKDIVLNENVTVHADPEQLVVKISEGVMREEVEEAAAAAEAPVAEAPEQPPAESKSEQA